jgi:hypothetical protein
VKATPAAEQPAALTQSKPAPVTGDFHDPFRNAPAAAGTAGSATGSTAGVAQTVTPADSAPSGDTGTGGVYGLKFGPEGNSPDPPPAPAPSSSGTATTVTPDTGTSSPPVDTTPATSPTTPSATGGYAAGYRVDVDWGPVADPKAIDDLTRMQILEVEDTPQIVYLGVREDGKHALFLIAMQHVSADGDGRCLPDADHCHVVSLARGESELIDMPTSIGVAQYQLTVDRLKERRVDSFEKATELREDVVKAGEKLVEQRINWGFTFVRRFVYLTRRGVVDYVAKNASER